MNVLPGTEDCTIAPSYLHLSEHKHKTPERDRQTDRQAETARSYYSSLYCEQYGRAVKILHLAKLS